MSSSSVPVSGTGKGEPFLSIKFPVKTTPRDSTPMQATVAASHVRFEPCDLWIPHNVLEKIIRKHIVSTTNEEPWGYFIPADSPCRNLLFKNGHVFPSQFYEEVARLIAVELGIAVEALVAVSFFFQRMPATGSKPMPERWVIILPSGAMAVFEWRQRGAKADLCLVSCYYHASCKSIAQPDGQALDDISRQEFSELTALYVFHRYWPTHRMDKSMAIEAYSTDVSDEYGDQIVERHHAPRLWTQESWGIRSDGFWSRGTFRTAQRRIRLNQGEGSYSQMRSKPSDLKETTR